VIRISWHSGISPTESEPSPNLGFLNEDPGRIKRLVNSKLWSQEYYIKLYNSLFCGAKSSEQNSPFLFQTTIFIINTVQFIIIYHPFKPCTPLTSVYKVCTVLASSVMFRFSKHLFLQNSRSWGSPYINQRKLLRALPLWIVVLVYLMEIKPTDTIAFSWQIPIHK